MRAERLRSLHARRADWGVRVVDAHTHLGAYGRFFIADHGLDGVIGAMDRAGVSLALCSSHLAIEIDAVRGNEVTAKAVDASEGRLLGYAVVNPWQNPERELARLDDERFVGVKIHPDLHSYAVTGPRYREVFAFSERTGCPVLVHTFAGSPFNATEQIARVLDEFPNATVVAGHAGAAMSEFDEMLALAKRHPGLHLEVCGSYIDRRVIERFIVELEGRQVLFGSDVPFIDLRVSLGRALHLDVDEDLFARFMGGNALRLTQWRSDDVPFAADAVRAGTMEP